MSCIMSTYGDLPCEAKLYSFHGEVMVAYGKLMFINRDALQRLQTPLRPMETDEAKFINRGCYSYRVPSMQCLCSQTCTIS